MPTNATQTLTLTASPDKTVVGSATGAKTISDTTKRPVSLAIDLITVADNSAFKPRTRQVHAIRAGGQEGHINTIQCKFENNGDGSTSYFGSNYVRFTMFGIAPCKRGSIPKTADSEPRPFVHVPQALTNHLNKTATTTGSNQQIYMWHIFPMPQPPPPTSNIYMINIRRRTQILLEQIILLQFD